MSFGHAQSSTLWAPTRIYQSSPIGRRRLAQTEYSVRSNRTSGTIDHMPIRALRGPYKDRIDLYREALKMRTTGVGYVFISKSIGVPWRTVANWVGHLKIPRSVSVEKFSERRKSKMVSKSAIRRKLIADRGNCCEECGLSKWRGYPLSLELHRMKKGPYHLVPLKLLCPNCHSLTPNWRGNGKVVKLAAA